MHDDETDGPEPTDEELERAVLGGPRHIRRRIQVAKAHDVAVYFELRRLGVSLFGVATLLLANCAAGD